MNPAAQAPDTAPGVVFHVLTPEAARTVLRNVINLRAVLGENTPVEVIAQGAGLELVLQASAAAPELAQLMGAGVGFAACRNSLHSRGLNPAGLTPGVAVVPAGVARAAQLQWRGYACIRP